MITPLARRECREDKGLHAERTAISVAGTVAGADVDRNVAMSRRLSRGALAVQLVVDGLLGQGEHAHYVLQDTPQILSWERFVSGDGINLVMATIMEHESLWN